MPRRFLSVMMPIAEFGGIKEIALPGTTAFSIRPSNLVNFCNSETDAHVVGKQIRPLLKVAQEYRTFKGSRLGSRMIRMYFHLLNLGIIVMLILTSEIAVISLSLMTLAKKIIRQVIID